jgi:hypothetical protein
MAWVAVNKDGSEYIFHDKPERLSVNWQDLMYGLYTDIRIPRGSIKKLIGRDLDWNDEPVELRNE